MMALKKKKDQIIEQRLDESLLRKKDGVEPPSDEKKKKKLNDILPPIRINKEIKEWLENHFEDKGTQLSSGIRMIIYDYVKKNKSSRI